MRLSPSGLRLPAALLIAAVAGALLSISLPPVGFWPVVFVAPIPLLWLVRGSRPGRASLCGFAFGFAYFGALLYWILLFGELGWAALVIMSAGFTAAFGALAPAVWRREHPLLGTLGLAGLWTVVEWIRGMIPLGGFGWGQLGVTQVDAPALPLASVGGVWALSFTVVVVAGLLLLAWERWGSGRRAGALALAIGAAAVAVVPAAIPIPAPNGRTVEVAAIQVDVASVQDLVGADEDVAVARLNIDRHLELARDPPDLVVWGEGALDPGVTADPLLMSAVSQAIATVGAPTIAGAVTADPDGTERTVTLAFDGTGRIVDRYVKVKLVPFGEYVPFRKQLGWISATDQVPVDRVPGERGNADLVAGSPPDRDADLLREQLPVDRPADGARGRGLPRRRDQQRLLRPDRRLRTAPADEPAPRGRERPLGGARRGLRDQRLHRRARRRRGFARPVRTRDDARDGPRLGPPNPFHPPGGLGAVGVRHPRRRPDRVPAGPQATAPRAGTAAVTSEDAGDPADVQRAGRRSAPCSTV